MDRSSPWEAGVAKQAETTREEQRKALTALVIRTLGSGICEMLGDKRDSPEYWAEVKQVLGRMLGGLPDDTKMTFFATITQAFMDEVAKRHPDIAAAADAAVADYQRRRHG
jgi:hypothetical protein